MLIKNNYGLIKKSKIKKKILKIPVTMIVKWNNYGNRFNILW